MRRVTKLAAVLLAGALAATACGGGDGGTTETGGGKGEEKTIKVGLAYDIGGRGDQSFNDAAARGLDRSKQEFGVEAKELEAQPGESDAAKAERLELLAQGGFDPIIAVGFAYAGPVKEVAAEYPDVSFALVDDASFTAKNVANLVFAEEEGSFLVGAAAALKSKTGHLGFVGGVNVPLIQKFEAGYIAGVEHVDPDATVDVKYLTQAPDFTGFNDPAKGKVAASGMYDAGADLVYHAAGGSGAGVFEAAMAANALAIGVDSDQYEQPSLAKVKDVIMTSMIKRVDVAVYDFIGSTVDGRPLTGVKVYNLEQNGVGYSTSGGQIDDIVPKLDEIKQQIISGEIKVPDKPQG